MHHSVNMALEFLLILVRKARSACGIGSRYGKGASGDRVVKANVFVMPLYTVNGVKGPHRPTLQGQAHVYSQGGHTGINRCPC